MTKSLRPKSLILYADDDYDDIELVREVFRSYSQSVELMTFSNGLELLDFISNTGPLEPPPCLVILDINMPKMDGKETLSRLRDIEEFKEIPVVLFTTSTMPAEKAFARSLGAGFVTKPLHISQVHQLVDQMLEHCSDEVKKDFREMRR